MTSTELRQIAEAARDTSCDCGLPSEDPNPDFHYWNCALVLARDTYQIALADPAVVLGLLDEMDEKQKQMEDALILLDAAHLGRKQQIITIMRTALTDIRDWRPIRGEPNDSSYEDLRAYMETRVGAALAEADRLEKK